MAPIYAGTRRALAAGMGRDPRDLDQSPEVVGLIADLLIVLTTFAVLGIFRC